MDIIIDREFKALIPPLAPEERTQLESNILAEGCRDPLVVWGGQSVLLDGHNRFEICQRLNIKFRVEELQITSREHAYNWIINNQLGRRNLHPDQASYLRGKRYNMEKVKQGTRNQHVEKDQNDTFQPTADKLAAEYKVGAATIKRDGKYAQAVDTLAAAGIDPHKVVAHETKSAVVELATAIAPEPEPTTPTMIPNKPKPIDPVVATVTEQVKRGEISVVDAARKIADEKRHAKKTAIVERLETVAAREVEEPTGLYDVIVIDPPWPMVKIERDVRPNQTAFDYPTMSEEELSAMTIPADDDCHVWVWTTHKFLPMSLRLIETWGLKYVCTFVWHKPGGFQPIGLPQYNCEMALYARKGSPAFIDTKAFNTCFQAPRGSHSEKPEEFYDVVRRVTGGRRLDMFNRRKIEGFAGWGKESA